MGDQKISCEGCGSKWILVGVDNQIAARLVECLPCVQRKRWSNVLLPGGSGESQKVFVSEVKSQILL